MQKKEKKPKPYMPWFIMDFERDTGHLSLEECEAYRRLLEAQWKRDARALPNDDVVLARLIRVDAEIWKRIRPVVEAFYDLSPGHWSHPKVVELWLWASAQMQAASEHGKKGAQARWSKDAMPEDMPEQCHPHSHSHSHSKPISEPQPESKAFIKRLANASDEGDLEDCMRRTRDVVGADEMKGKRYGFWRKLYRDCTAAYRDALVDCESRKKEAAMGLPEAQIEKTWAAYFVYRFKELKKTSASRHNPS